jgi:hypothetical protein
LSPSARPDIGHEPVRPAFELFPEVAWREGWANADGEEEKSR